MPFRIVLLLETPSIFAKKNMSCWSRLSFFSSFWCVSFPFLPAWWRLMLVTAVETFDPI
ncbi:hypothetical protein BD289DRAFT_432085 [Coniella lustricola]|uniref:Uncharacterized protein n=1 Tax=Coniella lustricola TaxID=2025994 RepID=A0A2T3AA53_9PEZI|nr:hypothetical protein BD289DRAFT_432085 [Coniella lustricola]